jgi:hypothetical protein
LLTTIQEAIPDLNLRAQVLSLNPARLYGFPIDSLAAAANNSLQGAMSV